MVLGQRAHEAQAIYWPPFTLDIEVAKNQWQPVEVSPNIASGEIFRYFPSQMPTAPWELIFLLLLSPDDDTDVYQCLFDTGEAPHTPAPPSIPYTPLLIHILHLTYLSYSPHFCYILLLLLLGLSPKQGLFAYIRLLDLMTQRASVWEDVPSYRKVFETEIRM